MSDEIRSRVERLIKAGPCMLKGGMHHRWLQWRSDIIDRLAAQARIFQYPSEAVTYLHLDPQPIRKGVTKREIINQLKQGKDAWFSENLKLIARIEAEGIADENIPKGGE